MNKLKKLMALLVVAVMLTMSMGATAMAADEPEPAPMPNVGTVNIYKDNKTSTSMADDAITNHNYTISPNASDSTKSDVTIQIERISKMGFWGYILPTTTMTLDDDTNIDFTVSSMPYTNGTLVITIPNNKLFTFDNGTSSWVANDTLKINVDFDLALSHKIFGTPDDHDGKSDMDAVADLVINPN